MDVDDDFTNIFIFDGGWWGCVHCAIAALGYGGLLWATNGGHVVLLDAVANSQQFNPIPTGVFGSKFNLPPPTKNRI